MRLFRFEPLVHSFEFVSSSLCLWNCLDLNRKFIFLFWFILPLWDCLDLNCMFILLHSIQCPSLCYCLDLKSLVHSFGFDSSSLTMRFRSESLVQSFGFDSFSLWDCLDLNLLFILLDLIQPLSLHMRFFRSESLIHSFKFDSSSLSMRLFRSESLIHSFGFGSSFLYEIV
jgi:hypothetical protein